MRYPRSRRASAVAAPQLTPQQAVGRATVVLLGALALAAAVGATAPAHAQIVAGNQVFACTSQQELEQTIQSDGSIVPDGCRSLSVSSLRSDGEELCLLDFDAGEEDLLGQLQEAALPSEWWVECDALAAAIAD